MKYTIEVSYQTGNSFGSEDTTGTVELEWENLDHAKAALQRIKEHYLWYNDKEKGRWGNDEPVPRPKWHEEKFGVLSYMNDCLLIFITDIGNEFQLYAFWCGYFERLHGAKIIAVTPEESDMEFTV